MTADMHSDALRLHLYCCSAFLQSRILLKQQRNEKTSQKGFVRLSPLYVRVKAAQTVISELVASPNFKGDWVSG